MSAPAARMPRRPGTYRAPAGLLEKLMAAVRPEFRAEDADLRPARPGVRRAAVRGERLRPARPQAGPVHARTGSGGGRPAGRTWPSSPRRPSPDWHGHLPLACVRHRRLQLRPMRPRDCASGTSASGTARDARTWRLAGTACAAAAVAAAGGLPDRLLRPVGARGTSPFCHTHDSRLEGQRAGPASDEFAAVLREPGPGLRADRPAAAARRAAAGDAVRAAVPRRRATDARLPPGHGPADRRGPGRQRARPRCWNSPREWWTGLDRAGQQGRGWRAVHPRRAPPRRGARRSAAAGTAEYPRDTWRLRNLGIDRARAPPSASRGIPQPWLKDLAKRWTPVAAGHRADAPATAGSGASGP